MSLADELLQIEQLHQRGVLDDDEFARAKAQLLSAPPTPAPALMAVNRFRRSASDRWIAGVCGGLARATGAESWVWRLVFTLLFFFAGSGVLLYILMWVFVPVESGPSTHLPDQLR
jgi:phage shock protein PspC (stress-responsive transcriptional regulator)